MKVYQYRATVIADRGHLDDPEYLAMLCEQGKLAGAVACPLCGGLGHAIANGWKHREEQAKGANMLTVLLEREIEILGGVHDAETIAED